MRKTPLLLAMSLSAMIMSTAFVEAATINHNGGAQSTAGGAMVWSTDPPGPCYNFVVNDIMVWQDQHVNINPLGSGVANYWVSFTIDVYEWVNGARGAWLAGANDWLGLTQPGQTLTNTQTVTATYTGWNGGTSCWTFEVYRTMTDKLGAFSSQSTIW